MSYGQPRITIELPDGTRHQNGYDGNSTRNLSKTLQAQDKTELDEPQNYGVSGQTDMRTQDGRNVINFVDQKQPKQGTSKKGKRRQRNSLARKESMQLTQEGASALDRASPAPDLVSMG